MIIQTCFVASRQQLHWGMSFEEAALGLILADIAAGICIIGGQEGVRNRGRLPGHSISRKRGTCGQFRVNEFRMNANLHQYCGAASHHAKRSRLPRVIRIDRPLLGWIAAA